MGTHWILQEIQITEKEKDTMGNMAIEAESQTRAKQDWEGEKAKITGKDNRVLY